MQSIIARQFCAAAQIRRLMTEGRVIMTNLEKYINAFVETFEIEADKTVTLKYQSIPTWDSVGHMNLIASLEEAFDIMMDTEDIIDFDSFEKGKVILAKYDVEF
jgi:acyl carrier protein